MPTTKIINPFAVLSDLEVDKELLNVLGLADSSEPSINIALKRLSTGKIREFGLGVYSGQLYQYAPLDGSFNSYPSLMGKILKRRVHVYLVQSSDITKKPELFLRVPEAVVPEEYRGLDDP